MAPPVPRRRRFPSLALLVGAATVLSLGLAGIPANARTAASGAKGAQVYCFMRSNGNSHEVSWAAAYALIKRENAGLFKTSPEHAAVLITETVVQNPSAYPDCPRYLGDLYRSKAAISAAKLETAPVEGGDTQAPVPMTRGERYGN
jgi:hypothetical protein